MTHKHTHCNYTHWHKNSGFFHFLPIIPPFSKKWLNIRQQHQWAKLFHRPYFFRQMHEILNQTLFVKEKGDVVCSQVKSMCVLDVSELVLYLTVQVEQESVSEREFCEWLRLNCSRFQRKTLNITFHQDLCDLSIWFTKPHVLTIWQCNHTHQV